MNFPKLQFPLTVDFASTGYWIDDQGQFPYGAAVTAFFIGGDIAEMTNDNISLLRELGQQLQTFGSHLQPYAKEQRMNTEIFLHPETVTDCSVCFAVHSLGDNAGIMVERFVFQNLRDFLCVELGRAILRGNAPRQCRLCGRWFLHEQGDRSIYCERIAPGEKDKTCREVGARTVFEKKIQNEDAWKLYKRAYKKYYARVMKGTMSEDEFRTWGEQAAADRDAAIRQIEATVDTTLRTQITQRLREELNKR